MEGGLNVIAKVLFVTDLHKRYKESSSIKGQLKVQNLIQQDIINFCIEQEVTHVVITGDWYDRGFHGVGQAFGAMEMDRRLSEAVNGNVYLCIGNHFYLERDDNPEMYIIQPNSILRPANPIPLPDKPIFQMVPKLRLGPVQISFFHYNKSNKDYVAYRDPDVNFHVGVYHDDACVPGWVREQEGYQGSSTQAYYRQIYDNIDWAIHGHIHVKVGMCSMDISTLDGVPKKVPMCIPGSLGITQNKDSMKHPFVDLPMLIVNDDGSHEAKLARFSTHIDELQFFATNKKKVEVNEEGAQLFKENRVMNVRADLKSIDSYLTNKGYTDFTLKLVDSLSKSQLSLADALTLIVSQEGSLNV